MKRYLGWPQIWVVLWALVLVGCGAPAYGENPTPSTASPPAVTPSLTPTLTPSATPVPTATPTATRTPTVTPTPSPTATSTETPVPPSLPHVTPVLTSTAVVTSYLPQPTPMPLIEQPDGTINILLLGSDRRPGVKVSLTDVMMIASIFPDTPGVSLISIPRDYYAWIPTWGMDKINTAYLRGYKNDYPGGGPGLVKATVEYNFGMPIHYYVMVDFNSYRGLVDAVGGVDVAVECPFHDTYPDPESPTGQTDIDLEPGIHHLDGKYALWYVRSRGPLSGSSDFDRHRRQQQVLRAIFDQAMSQNLIPRIPDFWNVYKEDIETDLGLTDMLYLGSVAARFDLRNLKSRFIRGSTLLESGTAPNGGYILIPKYEALYEFMLEAAQPPVTSRAQQRAHRVEVWNGSGNSEWGLVAAYRLDLEGFEVTEIKDVEGRPRTTVLDFTTTDKGSRLWKLRQLYDLESEDVVSQPTEGSAVDYRVILGWNYNPCTGTGTAHWHATPTPTPTATPE
ncbi:MAG: LCP family protein [Anaerolineae bacterium]